MRIRLSAVLDTNILVSGFLEPRGIPARVLGRAIDGSFELVTSDYILGELDEVLQGIEEVDGQTRLDARRLLTRICRKVQPLTGSWSERDPKDNPVVGTAVAAGTDFLVTGDRQLLSLKAVSGVDVVTVRKFNKKLAREAATSKAPRR